MALSVETGKPQVQNRRRRTGGFVIFNYGVPQARDLLPLLGMDITKNEE